GRRGTVSRHQRVSLRRAAQVDADPDTALPLTAPPARRRGGHALDRRGRRNHSGAAHGAGARQGERSTTEPPQTRHLLPHGAATQTSPRDPLHPTPPTPAPAPPLPLAPSSAIMKLSYPQTLTPLIQSLSIEASFVRRVDEDLGRPRSQTSQRARHPNNPGPITETHPMRKLIVSEFVSLDGVIQAPGGKDEDRDGGFEHGGWTWPYWHDDIGQSFAALMKDTDAFLLGRRTYVTHAQAFEPMPAGDLFGDMM